MKFITSLFAGFCCLSLGACQQMPNTPDFSDANSNAHSSPGATSQASSGFEVTQAFGGGTIGFGGGFAPAPAPIAAPAFSTAPLAPPITRTPINNVPVTTVAPLPAASFPSTSIPAAPLPAAPFPVAAPLTTTAPLPATSIPADPLPAAPLTATAPITTSAGTTHSAGVTASASADTEVNEPMPVAPPVGPGSNIPPPGIGFGYTNTYTSTLEN